MKKKILSLMLILIMLILPFGVLLNVKAVAISVDNSITNGQGKKVLNTADVTVAGINAGDQLNMYKLVDVYYNSSTNEMSYAFTDTFQDYLDSLPANDTYKNLTVDGYFALTDDKYCSSMTNGVCTRYSNAYMNSTTSTLNILVSQYTTYIREHNAIYSLLSEDDIYEMTTANGATSATADDVIAGAYLILPRNIAVINQEIGNGSGVYVTGTKFYGVMVANIVADVENGDWAFNDVEVDAKVGGTMLINGFVNQSAETVNGIAFSQSVNYITQQTYSHFVIANAGEEIPINAHSSIQTAYNNGVFRHIEITFPSQITYDLSKVAYVLERNIEAKIENNIYYWKNSGSFQQRGTVTTSSNKLALDYTYADDGYISLGFNLNIDEDNLNVGATGTSIVTTIYVIKDPYIDIGSVTSQDISNAFDTNNANYNSNQYVNIRKAVEKIDNTATFYVTGLTINNTNSSSTNLSGGEFAVYESYSNGTYSNQLGSNIVMDSNGTGTLSGLDPTQTYYLKQEKAPTGYRLYDDKIIVLPGSNDNTQYDSSTYQVVNVSNGMYTANVVNQANLSLPFTGGSGTVIYTVIGLIILAGAGIFLVLYKKNNKDKNDNKE